MRRTLLLVTFACALLLAPSAAAYENNIGSLGLVTPCCGGQALHGNRSNITAPTSMTVPQGTHALMRVYADTDLPLIQLGFQRTNDLVINNNPGCTSYYLAYFAETYGTDTWEARCYFLGFTNGGETHRYGLLRADPGSTYWYAWIDGTRTSISANLGRTSAARISAGGEITGCTGCQAAMENVRTSATFGPGGLPWQRYNEAVGWYTIQSWNHVCNGYAPPCASSGGGWSFNTGNFPTTWSVSH